MTVIGDSQLGLVLAEKNGAGWKLSTLIEGAGPVVWFDKPGKHGDVIDTDQSFTSKCGVIVHFDGESTDIAFGWTGSAIEKVWLSD